MIHYYSVSLPALLKRVPGQIIKRCYHKQGLWHIETSGENFNAKIRMRSEARGRPIKMQPMQVILADERSQSTAVPDKTRNPT